MIDEVAGLFIEPGEESIIAGVMRLLGDENIGKRLGSQARRRVVDEMNIHVIARRTDRILMSTLASGSPGSKQSR